MMFIRAIGLVIFLVSFPAFSQIMVWQEDTSSSEIPPVFDDAISWIRVSLNKPQLLTLAANDRVDVLLEEEVIKTAIIDVVNSFDGMTQIIGRFPNEQNSLIEIEFSGSETTGSVQFNSGGIGYRLRVGSSDKGYLVKQEVGNFICDGIPPAPEDGQIADISTALVTEALVTVPTVPIYNSRPGAARVIYLDFDGETVANTRWNSNFTGGAPIVAQPFDEDGDPNTYDDSEQNYIRTVWERTREAYSIYQVNVTTDKNVFNATAVSRRQRMLVTPTYEWYGNAAGGVAYRPSFGTATPAWGFTVFDGSNPGPNMGLISIHEMGHTVGLKHDGLNGAEYHPGQQGWGPYMGAPYRSSYTTFSNGGYAGATRSEQDLSIISGKLVSVSDGIGNSNGSASSAPDGTVIESEIRAFNDRDVFKFQAEKGQRIVTKVTALGGFPTVNTQSILYNANGTQLAADDRVPASPPPFPASVSLGSEIRYTATQTGTHYLHIKGNGYNGGPNYNHSSYGAVGRYSLEVSVGNINLVPIITLLFDEDESS